MKTEKKPNEPSCCPPTTVVKDEPDADPVKIKEEGTGGNDDTTGEDTSECPRDPCLDPSNGEGTMSGENQSANGNQPILNSVKQEGDPNNPTDNLSGKINLIRIYNSLLLVLIYMYVKHAFVFLFTCLILD